MKYIYENLNEQKIWFDLDNIIDCDYFKNADTLIWYLTYKWFDFKKRIFVFVDEFQYCKWAERIFKNIYDKFNNIKIIASGSASMEIKDKIQESLAGRKKIFYIYPLDLEEFISWKLILKGQQQDLISFEIFKNIKWPLSLIAKEYYQYLYEFMIWWWYPATVIRNDKQNVLEEIFDLYLKKDIIDFLNIKNISGFRKIITYLALNVGKLLNYTDISNFADVDMVTLKSYLEVLEQTFLIKQVKPFYTNKMKEIVKMPKVYFIDNGVRNYFIKNFVEDVDLRPDKGELFESVVFQELVKNKFDDIKYRRTKTRIEIDFIIDNVMYVDALEVKFKNVIKPKDLKWLETFKQLYKDKVRKTILVAKDRTDYSISIFDLVSELRD